MVSSAIAALFDGGAKNTPEIPMRGLISFIADLRNARARDVEEKRINKELANIRQKFKGGSLGGYDRKKYVCKLLYIYILGFDVDFGHLEAVNLISASKYSEKQIGYLAVTLFLHEQHELLHLVVNSIRKDLSGDNEIYNCLALHAIASVGSREMGDALAEDVHRLLISPSSKAFVKKKAALTLLRLYRKSPTIVQVEWTERIISIMDESDLGVVLSVTSLITKLAQDNPEEYKGCYVKAAQRLRRIVVDLDCAQDYYYYKVPCPWLQVKLLRLLRYFPPSDDTHIRNIIRDSIRQIVENASEIPKNIQQNNAQNAVLFEAINLTIHLENENELMVRLSARLGKFIQSKETNVRYLGLEAMTHLAARAETLDPIKKHQSIVIGALKDRDISVRRQGLDLLYSMCDVSNARGIVNELMRYLKSADYAIREEMVLKIAILTEKYASDIQWYVNVSLELISTAGDHVSDEVWQRVIQIVTNNEELQSYAASTILTYLRAEQCHETLVKIGSYILGEFGHLVVDQPKCSPIEQFSVLQNKFNSSAASTRNMILSAFVKFVNLFPEIKPQLLNAFKIYSHTLDSELQQRACEYLALALRPTDDLLRIVCDEMPPFPERASALLSRLHSKHAISDNKRTWITGSKDANTAEVDMTRTSPTKRAFADAMTTEPKLNSVSRNSNGDVPSTLMSNGKTNGAHASFKPTKMATAVHLSPNWQQGYERLLLKNDGVLYEDALIQIGCRMEYRGELGCIILYFKNKTTVTIESFTATVDNRNIEQIRIETKSIAPTTVNAGIQCQQMTMFEAKDGFVDSPTIRVSWLAGTLQALTLKLPIAIHKYMVGAILSTEDYFKRWKQIGAAPREAQEIFEVNNINSSHVKAIITALGWTILDGVDTKANNIVGASVLNTSASKYGCLMRLEPNDDKKMCRLTIRATNESIPQLLLDVMKSVLKSDTRTMILK